MDIDRLNQYLSKLEGAGLFIAYDLARETVVFKFCGNTGGPYDDGEIELTFHEVEIVHLPLSMFLPVNIEIAGQDEVERAIGRSYQSDDLKLFVIRDDEGVRWHVYAGSYRVNVLPIFWERPSGL